MVEKSHFKFQSMNNPTDNMSETINFFGFKIFNQSLEHLKKKDRIINTINPHSYCVAVKDNLFKKALIDSDILVADGVGIIYAEKLKSGKDMKRITGADIHEFLLKQAELNKSKVFYLGSSNEILEKIKLKINSTFRNIEVGTFSPPFKDNFSEEENDLIIKTINRFQPSILFVGMTAPKQEKWVLLNQNKIRSEKICSIGAVFDFYSGNKKRAPKILRVLGMEWIYRSFGSIRLARRNIISNPKFIIYVLRNLFK